MTDPLLPLSPPARRQLGRFVSGSLDSIDEAACRELERRGFISFANPALREDFPMVDKGWAAWGAGP